MTTPIDRKLFTARIAAMADYQIILNSELELIMEEIGAVGLKITNETNETYEITSESDAKGLFWIRGSGQLAIITRSDIRSLLRHTMLSNPTKIALHTKSMYGRLNSSNDIKYYKDLLIQRKMKKHADDVLFFLERRFMKIKDFNMQRKAIDNRSNVVEMKKAIRAFG